MRFTVNCSILHCWTALHCTVVDTWVQKKTTFIIVLYQMWIPRGVPARGSGDQGFFFFFHGGDYSESESQQERPDLILRKPLSSLEFRPCAHCSMPTHSPFHTIIIDYPAFCHLPQLADSTVETFCILMIIFQLLIMMWDMLLTSLNMSLTHYWTVS